MPFENSALFASRRTEPFTRDYGVSRGSNPATAPIDRYYIEQFIASYSTAISGDVLEIGGRFYTLKYGTKVNESFVLSLAHSNDSVDFVDDLTNPKLVQPQSFDCVICTQTIQYIYDFRSAIRTMYGSLRANGTLLLTCNGIAQISLQDRRLWGDYWRFTSESLERVLNEECRESSIHVQTFGNVLSATSFLYGLASEELTTDELDVRDETFQLIVSAAVRRLS